MDGRPRDEHKAGSPRQLHGPTNKRNPSQKRRKNKKRTHPYSNRFVKFLIIPPHNFSKKAVRRRIYPDFSVRASAARIEQ